MSLFELRHGKHYVTLFGLELSNVQISLSHVIVSYLDAKLVDNFEH